MELQIKDKTFDFDCRLGTAIKIKSEFNKTYTEIINEIDKLDVNNMINLLYCGLDKNEVDKTEFRKYILDNCGMADLYDYISWFIKQLQYPGLSEEEIEKKLLEKRQKAKKFQD